MIKQINVIINIHTHDNKAMSYEIKMYHHTIHLEYMYRKTNVGWHKFFKNDNRG